MKLQLRFHPQVWVNDYALEADPLGPTDWETEVTTLEEGIPEDDTYESDDFRHTSPHKWMADWCGPFWVEVLNRDSLEMPL